MSKYSYILDSIPTAEEVKKRLSQIQLEDLAIKFHPSLTLDNPMTYILYIHLNKNLTDEEKTTLFNIIDRLQEKENAEFEMLKNEFEK